MRRHPIKVVFVLAVFASAIVSAQPADASATVALTVHDFAFSPSTVTIPAGTTVQITNTGQYAHTWSSDPGDTQQWDSGPINPGSSFAVTFAQPGRFGFHCNIHTYMTGTIVVVASTPPTTAAPAPTAMPATTPPAMTSPAMTSPTAVHSAMAVPSAAVRTSRAARPTVLAHTGAPHANALVALAATMTLLGLALVASGARRRRRVDR
jgi:plastocyanin